MVFALIDGIRRVRRSFGLAVLLLLVNLAAALLLAVPVSRSLERSLRHQGAVMLYHLDYGIWNEWHDTQSGYAASFTPDILSLGLVFKSAADLLGGEIPATLFQTASGGRLAASSRLDWRILGLGVAYLAAQTVLLGGILGVFRDDRGWSVATVLHDSRLYAGRFSRLVLVALALGGLVFLLEAPFGRWVDRHARNAVSESTALVWSLTRYALLAGTLLFVSLLSGYARAIVVVEQRASALFAWRDAALFVARHFWKTTGHAVAIGALALVLLAVWDALDTALPTRGYATQLIAVVVTETMLLGMIGLRLSLAAGQMTLYVNSTTE